MQCFAAGNKRLRHRAAFTDMKRPVNRSGVVSGCRSRNHRWRVERDSHRWSQAARDCIGHTSAETRRFLSGSRWLCTDLVLGGRFRRLGNDRYPAQCHNRAVCSGQATCSVNRRRCSSIRYSRISRSVRFASSGTPQTRRTASFPTATRRGHSPASLQLALHSLPIPSAWSAAISHVRKRGSVCWPRCASLRMHRTSRGSSITSST